MSINQAVLKKLIEKKALISKADLNNAFEISKHLGCALSDVLLGRDLLSEEDYGEILSKYFKVKFIDLKKTDILPSVLRLIPEELAAEKSVVAFEKHGSKVYVAMEDPKDLELIEILKKIIGNGTKVVPFVATTSGIKNSLKIYKEKRGVVKEAKGKSESDENLSAIMLVEEFLENAVREEASDIHIEALPDNTLVRFRVDGVLHDYKVFTKKLHPSIIARIKILSNLKLDEQRLPQDGQFSYQTRTGEKISLRVSIVPSIYGEKGVLRILHTQITKFNLDELGLLYEDQEIVYKVLERTHGMFLVTGPTGSGKTTTLYTILGLLNKADVNIITIEDPVENKVHRVNQIQVNDEIHLSFSSGLRSILRQDPDIVMVGEIRDKDTAVIAVNAAMTGHLVFSSVHANTAAGAIPRMLDLGTEPFLLASTLNMVIAQRLVRILCPKCKEEVPISSLTRKKISEVRGGISPDIIKALTKNYIARGCPHCFGSGFRGRTGIFELLSITDDIKKLIVTKAPSDVIWDCARKGRPKTMLEDGLIKVSKGITTIEEVFRVISE